MRDKLNGLDLFSGIGGNAIALRDYVHNVAYCEYDKYCQGVLLSRMSEGLIDRAPIWDDVRTLTKNQFATRVDIITGGFPCQDISVAGNGAGLEGERSGLFFEIVRLLKELEPSFVYLENVPAIRTRGGQRVGQELAALGYDCRWGMLSAYDVGAPHLRERWFLLAKSSSGRLNQSQARQVELKRGTQIECASEVVPNTECLELRKQSRRSGGQSGTEAVQLGDHGQTQPMARQETKVNWLAEPNVDRVVNGLSFRVDRIKCLGNAVVPAQAKEAFERLIGLK